MNLTDTRTPYAAKIKAKDQAYKSKQKAKWLNELQPKKVNILKSALSQAFCGTSHLIACIDTILEIQGVEKHYPLFLEMQNEMVNMNTDLYKISVKNENDEQNRVEFEKKIDNIINAMPEFTLKQIELLDNFVTNLKHKK